MTTRIFAAALILCCCSCGNYAEFTLPAPDSNGPRAPFNWDARRDPVLPRGDASDVLNPSVVKFHGEYWNFYSEYDGHTWQTAAAASSDGVNWRKLGRVLSPSGWEGSYIAANGSAIVSNDEILYWYQAGDPVKIALARSRDGRSFQKEPAPVLETGPFESWDERAVADPYVIRRGDMFYLYYLGQDRARRQRLGIARSSDGVHWEKLISNPVLESGAAGAFDEMDLGEPAVWSSGGSYWMLYTGIDRSVRRRIGLARSGDGVHWERDANFSPIAGAEDWNREVMCDPTVEAMPDAIRVWFGGGDRPSRDQNLHGQIGLGRLYSK